MEDNGKIVTCETAGCGHKCCQFDHGNYIVLFPDELAEAARNGQSTAHLHVIDPDYHGGQKAVCIAKSPINCDNGLKPLDCKSYPFFPVAPENGEVDLLIKGKKCPLQIQCLGDHADGVRAQWNAVIDRNPAAAAWLGKVELVGYTEPVRHYRKFSIVATAARVA